MSSTQRYVVESFIADTIDGGGVKFKVTDTDTDMVATVPGGAFSCITRDESIARRWATKLNYADTYRSTLAIEPHDDLAQDLYPIFVALVDWLRKAGRTETNARRGAYAALRTIGVHPDIRVLIMRRYIAGARATAELDHEGRR